MSTPVQHPIFEQPNTAPHLAPLVPRRNWQRIAIASFAALAVIAVAFAAFSSFKTNALRDQLATEQAKAAREKADKDRIQKESLEAKAAQAEALQKQLAAERATQELAEKLAAAKAPKKAEAPVAKDDAETVKADDSDVIEYEVPKDKKLPRGLIGVCNVKGAEAQSAFIRAVYFATFPDSKGKKLSKDQIDAVGVLTPGVTWQIPANLCPPLANK